MERCEIEFIDRRAHVRKPAVTSVRVHVEGQVPHPQTGVPALLAVCRRPAPVLLEKPGEPFFRRPEVLLGVHRPQHRVVRDAAVERVDEPDERVVAPDLFVEADAHADPSGVSGGFFA